MVLGISRPNFRLVVCNMYTGRSPSKQVPAWLRVTANKKGLPKSCMRIFVPPTPISLSVLRSWLCRYPNREAADLLMNGFAQGFKLGFNGPRMGRDSDCPSSAAQRPQVVKENIHKEMSLGRIAATFDSPPFPNLQCSPIGLVPKHEPNSFRLIHHLSFPSGESVNNFIAKCDCAVHYTSFDQAVEMVMEAGHGAWTAKSDIKSAFRLLPVSPTDYELLGFRFDGKYYYDKCLPMGCSISCSLFETFITFLEFKVRQVTQSEFITHYLDDFLFVVSSAPGCGSLLQTFKGVCSALGVPIALEKTTSPSQSIIFLGLEIDSVEQQVSVPAGKVQALCTLVQTTLRKTKVTLRQIQSLIGSLNFVCRANAPGRAFTRRLNGPYQRGSESTSQGSDFIRGQAWFVSLVGISQPFQWCVAFSPAGLGNHNDTISLVYRCSREYWFRWLLWRALVPGALALCIPGQPTVHCFFRVLPTRGGCALLGSWAIKTGRCVFARTTLQLCIILSIANLLVVIRLCN